MEREREAWATALDDRALREELEALQVEVRHKRLRLEDPAPVASEDGARAALKAEVQRLARQADAADAELAQVEQRRRDIEGAIEKAKEQIEEAKVLTRGRQLRDLDPQALALEQEKENVQRFGVILAAAVVALPLLALIILLIVRFRG
jgi:hypothetical protein